MNISRMFTKKPLASIVSLGVKGKLGLVGRNEFPEVYEGGGSVDIYSDENLDWVYFNASPDNTISITEDGHEVTFSNFTATGGYNWPNEAETNNILIVNDTFSSPVSNCSSQGMRIKVHVPTPEPGITVSGYIYVAAYNYDLALGQLVDIGFGIVVSYTVSSNSDSAMAIQVIGDVMGDSGQVAYIDEPERLSMDDTLYLTFDKGENGFGRARAYADSTGNKVLLEARYLNTDVTNMPKHLIFNSVTMLGSNVGWDNPPPHMTEVPPITITTHPFVRTEQCDWLADDKFDWVVRNNDAGIPLTSSITQFDSGRELYISDLTIDARSTANYNQFTSNLLLTSENSFTTDPSEDEVRTISFTLDKLLSHLDNIGSASYTASVSVGLVESDPVNPVSGFIGINLTTTRGENSSYNEYTTFTIESVGNHFIGEQRVLFGSFQKTDEIILTIGATGVLKVYTLRDGVQTLRYVEDHELGEGYVIPSTVLAAIKLEGLHRYGEWYDNDSYGSSNDITDIKLQFNVDTSLTPSVDSETIVPLPVNGLAHIVDSLETPENRGSWYDFSDPNMLFSDVAGTILAAIGDPIRCMKDKWGSNHLINDTNINLFQREDGYVISTTGAWLGTDTVTGLNRTGPNSVYVSMHADTSTFDDDYLTIFHQGQEGSVRNATVYPYLAHSPMLAMNTTNGEGYYPTMRDHLDYMTGTEFTFGSQLQIHTNGQNKTNAGSGTVTSTGDGIYIGSNSVGGKLFKGKLYQILIGGTVNDGKFDSTDAINYLGGMGDSFPL